jgi:hypothetical protein
MSHMKTSHLLLVSLALAASAAPARAATTTAAHAAYLKPVVPFIENDYTRALAEARARKLPLFIEAWAPW